MLIVFFALQFKVSIKLKKWNDKKLIVNFYGKFLLGSRNGVDLSFIVDGNDSIIFILTKRVLLQSMLNE